MIRVRFAPSPTGFLHIGAARTALFNWLYARQNKGEMVLRIEDTDRKRSSEEMSRAILDGLKWLGIDWDVGPVYQSQRMPLYRKRAQELLEGGWAYHCYCSPEEIHQRLNESPDGGRSWIYDRRCLNLSSEEKMRFKKEDRPSALRFRVPDIELRYRDLIHGDIQVQSRTLEDFVLLRRDGLPTYHLTAVVDDIEMAITHVIRGDDHISNTPKQILLYRAFGAPPPKFAHLALILGPDKKKLSKRHGVTSILQFKNDGYLPLALMNFLSQMSWSPGESQALFSPEELIHRFSLKKLSKGSPVYDKKKLDWLNGRLISQMSENELFPLVKKRLNADGLWESALDGEKKAWVLKVIGLLKQRNRSIADFSARMKPFLSDDYEFDRKGVEKHLNEKALNSLMPLIAEDFQKMDDFSAENIEIVLRKRAENEGIKAALLIHSIRMLVLGMPVSPGIFDVLELVGKDKTIERIHNFPFVKKPFLLNGE